jgi:hypothetical protein
MLRKLICAGVVFAVSVHVVTAEELLGSITKVDRNKITFKKFKGVSKEVASATTEFTVVDKVKVVNAKFNKEKKEIEAGDDLKDGLKNERFANINKFGVVAQIVIDDRGRVSEIRVFPALRKVKAKDDK